MKENRDRKRKEFQDKESLDRYPGQLTHVPRMQADSRSPYASQRFAAAPLPLHTSALPEPHIPSPNSCQHHPKRASA